MDLKIQGRHAVVCASSSGLGLACAEALLAEGVNVVINGRDPERLRAAQERLVALGGIGQVSSVAADITTVEGRALLLSHCPEVDILINNNAGPKPGDFLEFGEDDWHLALSANLLAPLMLIRSVIPGMKARRFGRIVNITSAMVTAPRGHMTLSAASRSGLTAACKGLSRDLAPFNVTFNNLLPERFDTPRQIQMAHVVMRREGISFEDARQKQIDSIPAGRLGRPQEFGAACAYLCSDLSGYLSGQNLHLDGGAYPGLV